MIAPRTGRGLRDPACGVARVAPTCRRPSLRPARPTWRRSRRGARRRDRHRRPALARRARPPASWQFAKRPLDRLDPEIVEILRLSAYQLLHLTRVPAAAVVDDAVDLARRAGKTERDAASSTPCCAISRAQPAALPLPPRPADAGGSRRRRSTISSITLSHPRWLVARWLDRFGFDAAEALDAVQQHAAPR